NCHPPNQLPPPNQLVQAAVYGNPVRIVADTIGLNAPLVGVGLDANNYPIVPDHDVAWYNRSAHPGTGENVVLWGHVLRFRATPNIPAPFERLKELPIGAPITLYTDNDTARRYVVSDQIWAQPHEVGHILPQGYERLTLVSCIGDAVIANGGVVDMSHRLITIAMPVE
ncbi:MAG: class F sortase, partial [Chloroflexaceae bacterium]|nr:class F sortase [Chloroflexaceae bacterium]